LHYLKPKALNFEIKHIIDNDDLKIKLLSYDIDNAVDLDLSYLTDEEQIKYASFISTKRKLEYFYTRLLWSSFSTNTTISYLPSGKPYLTKGYISISHSRNKIAIAYSKQCAIGLDIEHFNEKIFRIQSKFTSLYEREHFDLSNHQLLTTIWSIKEAVYKLVDIPGLRFKEDICVLEIEKSNRVEVELRVSKKHLNFERIIYERFILTYCLLE
jgi:4'-phosphopantetheinyl transferase